jgi:hypothetical protein
MLSTTLKRTAATVGVVAGLLAAAVPASAQALPGVVGVTNRDSAGHTVLSIGGPEAASFVNGCAPGWSAPARQGKRHSGEAVAETYATASGECSSALVRAARRRRSAQNHGRRSGCPAVARRAQGCRGDSRSDVGDDDAVPAPQRHAAVGVGKVVERVADRAGDGFLARVADGQRGGSSA